MFRSGETRVGSNPTVLKILLLFAGVLHNFGPGTAAEQLKSAACPQLLFCLSREGREDSSPLIQIDDDTCLG